MVGDIPKYRGDHPQPSPDRSPVKTAPKPSPNHPLGDRKNVVKTCRHNPEMKHAANPPGAGSSPPNSKTRKFSMIFGNSHLMIDHENFQFLHLVPLENRNLPRVRFSYFLDRCMSTFSNRNHSVELQDLKLSTENLVAFLFCKVQ